MKKLLFILTLLIFLKLDVNAHAFGYDLNGLTGLETRWVYFKIGFQHIIPYGLDHILFVLGLFLLNTNLRTVILQTTVFTLAHSITLALSMTGIISPESSVIEPIIAMSILFIAIENMFIGELKWWRMLLIFVFGLIHGCGFASALMDVGVPEENQLSMLLTFNLGVEAGQLAVITIAWFLLAKWFNEKSWYRARVVIPISGVIGCIALYWTIERSFFS